MYAPAAYPFGAGSAIQAASRCWCSICALVQSAAVRVHPAVAGPDAQFREQFDGLPGANFMCVWRACDLSVSFCVWRRLIAQIPTHH